MFNIYFISFIANNVHIQKINNYQTFSVIKYLSINLISNEKIYIAVIYIAVILNNIYSYEI